MAVREVLKYPDEHLKQSSRPVSDFGADLHSLLQDLQDTMQAGPGGVGIAAPQIGEFLRIAIVDVSGRKNTPNNGLMILINPEIQTWDGMKIGREGCMSVPDFTGNVIRAEEIELIALNPEGEEIKYQCQGFEARAVQHEMDHLDGLLFLDRLVSRQKDLFRRKVYQPS